MAKYVTSYTNRFGDTWTESDDNTSDFADELTGVTLSNDTVTVVAQDTEWNGQIDGSVDEWICWNKTISLEDRASLYSNGVAGSHMWFINTKFIISGERTGTNAQRIGCADRADATDGPGKRSQTVGDNAASRSATSTPNFINCTFTFLDNGGATGFGTVVPATFVDCTLNYLEPDSDSLIVMPMNGAEVDTYTSDASSGNSARFPAFELFTSPETFDNVNVIGASSYFGNNQAEGNTVFLDGFSLAAQPAATDNNTSEADVMTIANFHDTGGCAVNFTSPKVEMDENGQIRWRSISGDDEQGRVCVIQRQDIQRKFYTDDTLTDESRYVKLFANTEVSFNEQGGAYQPPANDSGLSKTQHEFETGTLGTFVGTFNFDEGRDVQGVNEQVGTPSNPMRVPLQWIRRGTAADTSDGNNYSSVSYDLETDFTELSLYGIHNASYTRNSSDIRSTPDDDGFYISPDINNAIVDVRDRAIEADKYNLPLKIETLALEGSSATQPDEAVVVIEDIDDGIDAGEVAFFSAQPIGYNNGIPTTEPSKATSAPDKLWVTYHTDNNDLWASVAAYGVWLIWRAADRWALYYQDNHEGDGIEATGDDHATRVLTLAAKDESGGTVFPLSGTLNVEANASLANISEFTSSGTTTPNDIYAKYKKWCVDEGDINNYPVDNVSGSVFDISGNGVQDLSISDEFQFIGGRVEDDDDDNFKVYVVSMGTDDDDVIQTIKARNIDVNGITIQMPLDATANLFGLRNFSSFSGLDVSETNNNTALGTTIGGTVGLAATGTNRVYVFNNVEWDDATIQRAAGNFDDLIYLVGDTSREGLTVTQPASGSISVIKEVIVTVEGHADLGSGANTHYHFSQSSDGSTFTDVPDEDITLSVSGSTATFTVELDVTNGDNRLYYAVEALASNGEYSEILKGDTADNITESLVAIPTSSLDGGTFLSGNGITWNSQDDPWALDDDITSATETLDTNVSYGNGGVVNEHNTKRILRENLENSDRWMRAVARGYIPPNYFRYTDTGISMLSSTEVDRFVVSKPSNTNRLKLNVTMLDSTGGNLYDELSTNNSNTYVEFSPGDTVVNRSVIEEVLDERLVTKNNVGNIGSLKPAKELNGDIFTGN